MTCVKIVLFSTLLATHSVKAQEASSNSPPLTPLSCSIEKLPVRDCTCVDNDRILHYPNGTRCLKLNSTVYDFELTWKYGRCQGGDCIIDTIEPGCGTMDGADHTIERKKLPVGCLYTCFGGNSEDSEDSEDSEERKVMYGYFKPGSYCLHRETNGTYIKGRCKLDGEVTRCTVE
uniref:Uncharacterized protein HLSG-g23 n=1 Tax=Haemaphysalis longicornis TaxID=44386 RepID=Q4R195_HAELO|nr:hypothetical protein [Haemaphysalis longicornis]